ncbi:Chs7p SCDLUD_002946 [Saccharomycodes ludwigii]|uniref:Chs7p n=1 Tax=Saccharomycodes ludwigii TaxID=36035 RepID=UPI001E8A5289|nr:hypothetical protein SCDLUD_002946 [Saccharomycodes ludwigii]KAH3901451.1 hypothetical protein SCDLUD_002946 [Saccharomycodes ludwigii]
MKFNNFYRLCSKTPILLCTLIRSTDYLTGHNITYKNKDTFTDEPLKNPLKLNILPTCYSRSIFVANTIIFQIGNAIINIGTLFILSIILYSIRQKFTAIGRDEYMYLFQLIICFILLSLIADCGVAPPNSISYSYIVAIQVAFAGASCWALTVSGLLNFRFWEDGTRKSMFIIRGISFIGFSLNLFACLAISLKWFTDSSSNNNNSVGDGNHNNEHAIILMTVIFVSNALCILIFIASQFLASIFVSKNYWGFGVVCINVLFFVTGLIVTFGISDIVCEKTKHYLDGLFFGSLFNLFSYMMIYKVWDINTSKDLEFNVYLNNEDETIYNEYKLGIK